jgi:DNA replication and repair protein RecF
MKIRHLSLTNFRNFIRLESDFSSGPTIVFGSNGQGKTSLLEAVNYLTSASSPHATNERQLINFLALEQQPPVCRIVAEIDASGRPQRIEIRLFIEGSTANGNGRLRKEILINGIKRRVRDLSGVFNAVLFLPQDMEIVEGSPSIRRRFLDASISQADPLYAAAISDYAKVLTNRNALLKQIQENSASTDELTYWDEQLCDLASEIIRSRTLALSELEQLALPLHSRLTRAQETLRLDYLPAYDPIRPRGGQMDLPMDERFDRSGFTRAQLRAGMLEELELTRREEVARGMTTIGPHRDDIQMLVNGVDLRAYGSRGQNRTAILSLKLAEIQWLEMRTQEKPVLLLDEVLAELDLHRRMDLLSTVEIAPQSLLTAADLEMFPEGFRTRARMWKIEAGRIHPNPPASDSEENQSEK